MVAMENEQGALGRFGMTLRKRDSAGAFSVVLTRG